VLDSELQQVTSEEDAPLRSVIEVVRDDLRARAAALAGQIELVETALSAFGPPAPGIRYLWAGCEEAALRAIAEMTTKDCPPSERLVEFETALVLGEAWCRLAECERHFGSVAA
jgi:hypothetical protein